MLDKITFSKDQQSRNNFVDKVMKKIFMLAAIFASISVLFIVFFIFIKAVQPFLPSYEYGQVDLFSFLFGDTYRSDQGVYQIGFIIINTIMISIGAIILSTPISVISALFVSKIAPNNIKRVLTYSIELLASIPSVIYGVFAYGSITILVSNLAHVLGFHTIQGLSMLSTILTLAIMIFPTITLIAITSINSVSKTVEEASLALGASKMQTNYKIVLRCAKEGIFSGIILGLGRSFGEATAISMIIGNAMVGPTFNLFDPSRTLTSTILVGLKETSGLDYDIRFSIGFVLLMIILLSNIALNMIKRRVS